MERFILKKRRGLSFIEVVMTCLFVTTLTTGAIFITSHIKSLGDISATKSKVGALGIKVGEYYSRNEVFPDSLSKIPNESDSSLVDPWGKSYSYKANNGFFIIVSGGPDKVIQTSLTDKFDKPSGDDIGICLETE